jgi:hypothetical protein
MGIRVSRDVENSFIRRRTKRPPETLLPCSIGACQKAAAALPWYFFLVLGMTAGASEPASRAFPAGGLGESGDILVELLAGTDKTDTVVLGKHIRVLVSADGTRVKSVTPLSKGALEMSTRHEGGPVKALFVTEIVTDYPVETHVFASMFSGLPLYVATARGNWLVDGDSIRLVSARDNPGAPKDKEVGKRRGASEERK